MLEGRRVFFTWGEVAPGGDLEFEIGLEVDGRPGAGTMNFTAVLLHPSTGVKGRRGAGGGGVNDLFQYPVQPAVQALLSDPLSFKFHIIV